MCTESLRSLSPHLPSLAPSHTRCPSSHAHTLVLHTYSSACPVCPPLTQGSPNISLACTNLMLLAMFDYHNYSFNILKIYFKILTILFLKIFIYLFIWLCQVLVAACRIFSCGMRTPSCGMHAGSSSLTRDRTQAPCTGSMDSYPLDHQGSS